MAPAILTLATCFAASIALALGYSFERDIDALFPIRRDSIDNDNSTAWPARTHLLLLNPSSCVLTPFEHFSTS